MNKKNTRLTNLLCIAALCILTLTACGKKPSTLLPPEAESDPDYPRDYPAPLPPYQSKEYNN